MKDIPRNELLDKLDAGWKVRRKSWVKECTISKCGGSTTAHWLDFINEDWEGEPGGPIKLLEGIGVRAAFEKLANDNQVEFIRRASWYSHKLTLERDAEYVHSLRVVDILAKDWEVWG
jgi:hypothetical protein